MLLPPITNRTAVSESIKRKFYCEYGDDVVTKLTNKISEQQKDNTLALKRSKNTMSIIDNEIPLADDDPQVIIKSDDEPNVKPEYEPSMTSLRSSYTNCSSTSHSSHLSLDGDVSPDEKEEKARLISQVLELQNTLDDLSQRVDSVKEENLKLRSENQVLGQYIENLMSASSVFQSTNANTTKK